MQQLVDSARRELTAGGGAAPVLSVMIGALIALFPFSMLGGSLVDGFASTIAVLFLVQSIVDRDFTWVRVPWIVVGLLLWAYLIVRGLLSIEPAASSIAAAVWGRFVLMAAALSVFLPRSPSLQRLLLLSTVGMALFGAADALLQYATGADLFGKPSLSDRLTGPLSRPAIGFVILFGGMAAIVALLSTASANDRSMRARVAAISGLLLIYIAIALSGERMPFIQSGLALMVLLFIVPSWIKMIAVGLVGIVALFALLVFAPGAGQRQASVTSELAQANRSTYGRAMTAGIEVAAANPIFGSGLKAYSAACTAQVSPTAKDGCRFNHSHHLIIQLMAETGLVGLVGFTTLLVLALGSAVRHLRDYAAQPLLAGNTLAILIMFFPLMTFGGFFSNWRAALIWFVLGTAAALARGLPPRAAARANLPSGAVDKPL